MTRFTSIKHQMCVQDFYNKLSVALLKADGNPHNISIYKDITLDAVVHMLAHNGIRMMYYPPGHMDKITNEQMNAFQVAQGAGAKDKSLAVSELLDI